MTDAVTDAVSDAVSDAGIDAVTDAVTDAGTDVLAGRAITVVGIYFAPDSTGIAPYTTHLCATLAALGSRVSAVTGVPHYPGWTVGRSDRFRLYRREEHGGLRLTRVRHFVPSRQDVLRRGLYEATFYLGSRLATRTHRPELVIGVTPNLAGAATAAALAGRHGVPFGVIVQDLVGRAADQSGIRGGHRFARWITSAELGVLRRADRIGVVTDAFLPALVAAGIPPGRVVRMPNHTHIEPVAVSAADARRRLGWPATPRLAVHTGNMGLKQGLHNVIEAARLAAGRRDDLLFVLVGDGSTRDGLRRAAAGLPNVLFVDPLPESRYPLALAAADCLLLNERASVRDMSMPSKLTSYFAAGRPVVAATSPHSAAAAELARSGAGLLVEPDRPADLLAAVLRIVGDPGLGAGYGRDGRRYAAERLSAPAAAERVAEFARALCTPAVPATVR